MEKSMNTKNHKKRTNNRESGQTIVMMAFLIIGLIGALGLAIDGGRIYFTRRNTQNAVDAALMAATHALCTQRDPILAGMEAAKASGLEHNGEDVWVTISNPPIQFIDTNEDIRYYVDVYVTQTIQPFFIQFVYDGELTVTSDGVAFCRPPFDPMTVPAMYAASTCGGCAFDGVAGGASSISASISEGEFKSPGGLFGSNGDIAINGSESAGHETELTGDIETPCDFVGKGTVEQPGTEVFEGPDADPRGEMPLPYSIEHFMPGGYFAEKALAKEYDTNGDGITEGPDGIYWEITPTTVAANPGVEPYSWYKLATNTWTPDGPIEGLYYVEGNVVVGNKADFWDTTSDVNSDWNGVTIAANGTVDNQELGKINFGGGTDMVYYVGGFILFSNYNPAVYSCNTNDDGITSSGELSLQGVMYAPHSGISFSANDINIIGAMIGQRVSFSAAVVYYEYDPTILDPLPPSVQMAK
jgi:hypothetical protein